jgi:hypothetical protein
MKKITLFFVSLWLITALVIAQTPQAFKYQAVARTSSGNLIQNQLVAFRISILQGGPLGTLLFQERHTTNTNNYGLANLDIGSGVVLFGTFSSINWSVGQMYIKVELDPLGGTSYIDMGATQLLSVPYSLYSETSGDAGLTLPYDGNTSTNSYAFSVTNSLSSAIRGKASGTSQSAFGVYGESASDFGIGVKGFGTCNSVSGTSYGVSGTSSSFYGTGVHGSASSSTGPNFGVFGESASDYGTGVYGRAISNTSSGSSFGVYGESYSFYGTGVYGLASSSAGITNGLKGEVFSPYGHGVSGIASSATGPTYGVYGKSVSSSGIGVYGLSTATDGTTSGVEGESSTSSGHGVSGYATHTTGYNYGVYGQSASSNGFGVYGSATSSTGYAYAVGGHVVSPNGYSGYFWGGKFSVYSNVGIGTMDPDYPLVVKSTGLSTIMARFENYNTTDPVIMLRQSGNGSGGFYMYDGSNTNTIFLYGEGTSFINSGNLGIGTSSPTQLLDVNGGARVRGMTTGVISSGVYRTSDGTLITGSSDVRLKENIMPLQNSLEKVMELKGISFTWKADPNKKVSIGFIAQEFEKVIPELVFTNEVDGYKGINYAEVSAVLVEAMKELNTKIDKIENENVLLKAKNDQLKAENEKINTRLDKIEASMSLSAANNQ